MLALYQTAVLLQKVIASVGAALANRHALLQPLVDVIGDCPVRLYPGWLGAELRAVVDAVRAVTTVAPAPVLAMKKLFRIVELLEPDLEDRFDPARDITKALKDKVKKETRATKRVLRANVKERIMGEFVEDRKQARMRVKKTMEIVNGINQR